MDHVFRYQGRKDLLEAIESALKPFIAVLTALKLLIEVIHRV